MVERGGGDLLDRLGSDLFAAVLQYLYDPADLVRLSTVSRSWRRFVIANGLCKKLCLRTNPELSCFVRAIEIGGLSDTVEVGPNCSVQWQTLESEHRIYAYFGYRIISPKIFTEIDVESTAASTTTDRIENIIPSNINPDMFYFDWSSKEKFSLTFKLSSRFCVVREIKIQLRQVLFLGAPLGSPVIKLRFRIGHMRDESAIPQESLVGNFIWAYISPEFLMIETDDFRSLKLQRPIICIDGVLQIELLSSDSTDELLNKSACQIKVIACPLAPVVDASPLDRMGKSILMYVPGAKQFLEDSAVRCSSSRYKVWNKTKRIKKSH